MSDGPAGDHAGRSGGDGDADPDGAPAGDGGDGAHGSGSVTLVVLAKPPLPGRCKARLAAGLGEDAAARLARAMLQDVWTATATFAASPGRPEDRARSALACCDDHEPSGVTVRLATCDGPERYPRLSPAARQVPQGQGDLGRRMARLVAEGAGRDDVVLLLGTDSPGLPPSHLRAALAALHGADLVLGPADNGGFWCLGARHGHPALADPDWLDGLDWSLQDTLPQVLARAAERGLTVAEAPPWFDVDHPPDLERLAGVLAEHPHRAPRLARLLDARRAPAAADPADAALVSVILPTRDEGLLLDEALTRLRDQPGPVELIVADGGSRDGSVERALDAPDVTVVTAPPGRGAQLAAGAALATGPLLLFLHVDTRLPDDALATIRQRLGDGHCEAAAFVTRTVADPSLPDRAGPLLRLADLRSRITRHPYGDQGLAVRRDVYEAVGGYRVLPIMEDYDLAVRLARRHPIARLRPAVTVSGRGMQQRPLRAAWLMRVIPPLYRLGVSPERLARMYRGG